VIVTSYDDEAEGEMAEGTDGKTRITRITLRPKIAYGDAAPTGEMLEDLHHKAHEACFIANSITSEIVIEPR
jgi:organic hydroperoxide reductase OsmC/OhrA